MKRLFVLLSLALAGGSAWGQDGTVPPDVLDHMSIFSQNRAAGGDQTPPLPPRGDARPPGSAPLPAFVGAIDESGNIVALIEMGGTSGQYIEVRPGDTIAGGFRVEQITLQRISVSDGTRSRAVDIGNDLMNQPRILLPAAPAPRLPAGPGMHLRNFPGRGGAAQS